MRDKPEISRMWLIRAGNHGENEESAHSEGKPIIGFQAELPLKRVWMLVREVEES